MILNVSELYEKKKDFNDGFGISVHCNVWWKTDESPYKNWEFSFPRI